MSVHFLRNIHTGKRDAVVLRTPIGTLYVGAARWLYDDNPRRYRKSRVRWYPRSFQRGRY